MKSFGKSVLEGSGGTRFEMDVDKLQATEEQKAIVERMMQLGGPEKLNEVERNKIKDLKALIGQKGASPNLVVRFDWKWVRID